MAVTSKDVALRANVSAMTVSRVFSPRPGFPIAEATRERVRAAASDLGYRPNRLARALVTGRTLVVTVHIPELSAYYAQVIRSLQSLLSESHYEMIMLIDAYQPGQPDAPLPDRRPFPSDGILAVDLPGPMAEDLVRQNRENTNTPLVSIGTHSFQDNDFVVVDLYAGTLKAISHLVSTGAKRIGYIVWDLVNHSGDARRAAYDVAMRDAGLEPIYYPISWPTREVARNEMALLLSNDNLPDALFCFNDDCAIGTYSVLRDRGIRVPEDILLCGCDGLPDTEYLATPLTTVAQPIQTMCEHAWEFLEKRINNPELPPQQETLTPHLIVRKSTQK